MLQKERESGREGVAERGGSSINLLTCSLPQQASQKKEILLFIESRL